MTKSRKPDITSLIALASVSVEMLENYDHETIHASVHETASTPVQDLGPKIQILTIDLEVPLKEISHPHDSQQPADPSTPHQPIIDHLSHELAQSTNKNEGYIKLIVE